MNRLALLGVVACLWVCVLTGTGRAGSITYDFYRGGTLLAEFTTPDFVVLDRFFPHVPLAVAPAGLDSPGLVVGGFFSTIGSMPTIIYGADQPASELDGVLAGGQFPTAAGTYALDTSFDPIVGTTVSRILDRNEQQIATPDTLVVSTSGVTATPEPASVTLLAFGLASMAGCGWRRRKPATA